MTNFAKEQREKYNATASATNVETPMGKYLKESLDNFNFTDYFNALCDSLEEHYRKEEIKMDYGNPNDLFDAISYSVDAVNKTLADSTKGCCCNAEKEETKMNYEKPNYLSDSDECRGSINKVADKLDGVRTEDRIYQTAKTPIYPEHDICNEPIKDNNIVCSDSHTTDFEPTVTSNPCVSVLSKALVQLDKGEITLSEIANLAWILSDIFSDED
jgi:hypothetical protein